MLYVEILIVLALVLLNGFFAMSELAVVSSRRARLQALARAGVPGSRTALALAEEPSTFLPTVQIGITLVGVLAGAFSGATVATKLAVWLDGFPVVQPISHGLAIALVVAAITYLSLIIGELVPKQIALRNAEGTEAGVFERSEREIIERALRLDDRSVQTIMTPRHEVVWIDIADGPAEIARMIRESGHSRYPVCRNSPDEVLGIVLVRDLLAQAFEGKPFDLKSALRAVPAVHESTTALEALEMVRASAVPIALVVDEYGSLQGLATVKDITEAIVGTIREGEQPELPEAMRRDDGSWLVDGLMAIPEAKHVIGIPDVPENEGFHTIAGFVMWRLGRVPKAGDRFEWRDWGFEVVDMDGRRIDKIAVTPPAPGVEEEPLD